MVQLSVLLSPRTPTRKGDTSMTDTTERGEVSREPLPPSAIASGLAFSGLMNARSTEVTLRWDGFRTALQLNVAGLVGVTIWLLGERTTTEIGLALCASLLGVLWNFFHYKLLGRDGKFLGLWNESVVDIERINGIQGDVKIFSSDRYNELRRREPTVQYMLRTGSVTFIVGWCWAGLWAFLVLL